MKKGFRYISVNGVALLLLAVVALIRNNTIQTIALCAAGLCMLYNLIVFLRPRWPAKNQGKGTQPTPSAQRPPQNSAAATVPQAPVQRMIVPEINANYKAVFLRHVNCRITQKLQGAFPGATWSWRCDNPADIAAGGGIARIQTFNTGNNNFAEIVFEQSGNFKISMLQMQELGKLDVSTSTPTTDATKDPDSVDLRDWYELSASSAIRATIDEVNTRGYLSLHIDESGEVFIVENQQHIKQGKLNFMPSKKLWQDLVPLFADDDIQAAVADEFMTLTWA